MAVETIDVTPTWESVLSLLLVTYESGTPIGRKLALGELQRMARIADAYAMLKRAGDVPAVEDQANVKG